MIVIETNGLEAKILIVYKQNLNFEWNGIYSVDLRKHSIKDTGGRTQKA